MYLTGAIRDNAEMTELSSDKTINATSKSEKIVNRNAQLDENFLNVITIAEAIIRILRSRHPD